MIGFTEHQALLAKAGEKATQPELTRLRDGNARLVDAINEYFASGANAYTSGGHHFYCSETRRVGPCDCAYGRLMDAKAKVSS